MSSLRIDNFIANMCMITRKEAHQAIKNGKVTVNGNVITSKNEKINPDNDQITYNNKLIEYTEFEYIMLNKPMGVITATRDNKEKTVMDLIEGSIRSDLFPVGRLDKDTTGLLLITNDGDLAHRLLSPAKHVDKTYFAKVLGKCDDETVRLFAEGIIYDEEFKALPAKLEILEAGEISSVKVTIKEGKFHQIKRMFEAVGMKVLELERLSMGTLKLDDGLKRGKFRHLTPKEIEGLKAMN